MTPDHPRLRRSRFPQLTAHPSLPPTLGTLTLEGLGRKTWLRKPPRPDEGPRVDGALTTQPMAPVVPLVRNTSAVSMQSPPASAEGTSQHLVSRVRPPRSISQVQVLLYQLGKAEVQGQGGRKEQSSVGHQAVVVEGDLDAVGVARGSIYWVLLFWGRSSVSKTIIPEAQEHFLVSSGPCYTPCLGGLGLNLKVCLGNRQCVSLRNLKDQNPSSHRRKPVSRKVHSALFPGFRRSPK